MLFLFLFLNIFVTVRSSIVIGDVDGNEDKPVAVEKSRFFDGVKADVPLTTEAGVELLEHWMHQAFSGLMSAVAQKKMAHLEDEDKEALEECSKKVHTVHDHAKCLVDLIEAEKRAKTKTIKPIRIKSRRLKIGTRKLRDKEKKLRRKFKKLRRTAKKSKQETRFTQLSKKLELRKMKKEKDHAWVGAFKIRKKRAIAQKSSYDLLDEMHEHSPFGIVAKHLTSVVRSFKGKENEERKSWRETLSELKSEVAKVKEKKKKDREIRRKMQDLVSARTRFPKAPSKEFDFLKFNDRKPLAMLEENLEEIEDLKAFADKDDSELTEQQRLMRTPIKFIRDGVKLGMMLAGQNVSQFDNQTVKVISPRIMALSPESGDQVDVLSPSLFSLHDEGRGLERSLSLGNLTRGGWNVGHDTDALMEFVLEASGVSDTVNMLKTGDFMRSEEEQMMHRLRNANNTPLYFTKENVTKLYGDYERRKIEIFEQLEKTYTDIQRKDFTSHGYSMMSRAQLELVYGADSPFNSSRLPEMFNVSKADVEKAIEEQIRLVARDAEAFRLRKKDVVLSPVLLTAFIANPAAVSAPVILSPLLFAPLILSPAVYGVVLLSPWVFVPVILGPRLMCPVILSPFLMSPIILSPHVFDPIILCAGAMVPFVLSPFLMSPFVLSPVALTPLILSPFCLNPFIFAPNVLSPIVASPFVLSPILYSPAFVSTVLLSPHALSPIIQSDSGSVSVIASPSWLS